MRNSQLISLLVLSQIPSTEPPTAPAGLPDSLRDAWLARAAEQNRARQETWLTEFSRLQDLTNRYVEYERGVIQVANRRAKHAKKRLDNLDTAIETARTTGNYRPWLEAMGLSPGEWGAPMEETMERLVDLLFGKGQKPNTDSDPADTDVAPLVETTADTDATE